MDGGMLSQDEINALLNGMNLDGGEGGGDAGGGGAQADQSLLSDMEKDAIGEVANISMGSSATTLFSLVNRKVDISTPAVELSTWDTMTQEYEKPCVFIQIRYTVGLEGTNVLILREKDVKIITDLMMGGDGSNTEGELGELHLSAICEAMNQMMGSSATSLATMLGKGMIDISPPEASLIDLTEFQKGTDIAEFLGGTFVKITFRMTIGDLVDSSIMQLYPVDFAKQLVTTFIDMQMGGSGGDSAPAPEAPAPAPAPEAAQAPPQGAPMPPGAPPQGMPMPGPMPGYDPSQMPPGGYYPPPPYGYMPQMGMPMMQQNMNVQPAQFQSFSGDYPGIENHENIGLIMDVPLEVTVELGRTKKSISEILDFAPGTIIELDKIAGEPIDVLVNGKFVAKGEVVVIEESFGVRVTEIIK